MSTLAGKRILVVDDEVLVALMAANMLEDLGATVVGPAGRIEQALALVAGEAIDAVVLDVNMEGERSDAVAQALRDRDIPFVFATGYGGSGGFASGGEPVVDKPYTQEQLALALERVLRRRQ